MSTIAVAPGFRPAAVRRPARCAASTPAVRLTRRGRIVMTLVFLGLVLAVLTVFGARSAATGETGSPVPTRTVEVGQGDTMWGIASAVAEPGHVREMIHQIEELNALSGPALVEGQEIAIPIG
jgi:hypothetical protein